MTLTTAVQVQLDTQLEHIDGVAYLGDLAVDAWHMFLAFLVVVFILLGVFTVVDWIITAIWGPTKHG